jgi:glycosyltransferase involved in cell wall biosynthesis
VKIALIAPFEEPVPPRTYGGTELVVYNLAEELVATGHDVVVLASGDSQTSARLEPVFPQSLRSLADIGVCGVRDVFDILSIGKLIEKLNDEDFDIIHNHHTWRLCAFSHLLKAPMITTFHGRMDLPYYPRAFDELKNCAYTSISNSQRKPLPNLNYVATVYNGIDTSSYEWNDSPEDYLVFLGRFSPEKGPVHAIKTAKACGRRLIMAGKVDPVDREFFEAEVEPLIDGNQITFVGEVNHPQKNELLRNASVLLMPIDWEEPFGLVMVEAMATGTPVVATRRGSVPEVVSEASGVIVDSFNDMAEAVSVAERLDRKSCRDYVCERFSRLAMANGYCAAYEKFLSGLCMTEEQKADRADQGVSELMELQN